MENDKIWDTILTVISSGGLSAVVVKLLNHKSEKDDIDIKRRDSNIDSALEISEAARQLLADVSEQLKQCQTRVRELETEIKNKGRENGDS